MALPDEARERLIALASGQPDPAAETPSEADQPAEGDSETADTPPEASTAPEPRILDTTEHADHIVTVTIDGEEVSVPLQEALKGYQRQSDYTRKTQLLADERQQASAAREKAALYDRLYSDMQADPRGTIHRLARASNVDLTPSTTAAAADPSDPYAQHDPAPASAPVASEAPDPMAQRIAALEQALTTMSGYVQTQAATGELDRMRAAGYSIPPDLTPEEVFAHQRRTGANSFESAVRDLTYDGLRETAAADATQQAVLAAAQSQQNMADGTALNSTPAATPAAPTEVSPDAFRKGGRLDREKFNKAVLGMWAAADQ